MITNHAIIIKLSAPTIFPDLNKSEGHDTEFARDVLTIHRLKFKHMKTLHQVDDEHQIIQLISKLTGLSEADIDELYAEDVAEVTSVVFGFMQKYVELAQKMSSGRPA